MLRKLFGGKDKPPPFAPPPLTDSLRTTILGSLGLRSIPVMPGAAQQAFQLATNPKADASDFIEVIEGDEALSARILKIANSVFYDRGGGSKTIPDAVQVIGTAELRGLLNATALTDLFSMKHPLRAQLWAHDIATALTARLLARRMLPSLADQAFLAGLMHDVGKLLLLQRHTDTYERIARKVSAERIEAVTVECEEYPFDHTEVGQLIAERWNFSSELQMIIRGHHTPWESLPPLSLISVVKGADIFTNALGLGFEGPMLGVRKLYEPQIDPAFEALRIGSAERKPLLEEIRRTFDSEFELFSSWGAA